MERKKTLDELDNGQLVEAISISTAAFVLNSNPRVRDALQRAVEEWIRRGRGKERGWIVDDDERGEFPH